MTFQERLDQILAAREIVPNHQGVPMDRWTGAPVNPEGWQVADTSVDSFEDMIRARRHTTDSDACYSQPNGEGKWVVWDLEWDEFLDERVYDTEADAEAAAWAAIYERYDDPDVNFSEYSESTEKNSPAGW